jgi:hypothetical protein
VSLSQCCPCVSCVPGQVAGLLLPHLAGTVTEGGGEYAGRVVLRVRPAAAQAACPGCGTLSGRVHGGYQRRLRDVPVGGCAGGPGRGWQPRWGPRRRAGRR